MQIEPEGDTITIEADVLPAPSDGNPSGSPGTTRATAASKGTAADEDIQPHLKVTCTSMSGHTSGRIDLRVGLSSLYYLTSMYFFRF